MPKDTVKVTLNLHPREVEMVQDLARRRGDTHTNVIRTAIRTENLLTTEELRGSRIYLEEPDGTRTWLVHPLGFIL